MSTICPPDKPTMLFQMTRRQVMFGVPYVAAWPLFWHTAMAGTKGCGNSASAKLVMVRGWVLRADDLGALVENDS